MKHGYSLVGLLAMAWVVGCGSDAGFEPSSSSGDGSQGSVNGSTGESAPASDTEGAPFAAVDEPIVQAETLHEFSVRGTNVTIVALNGTVMMGYQRPAHAPIVMAKATDGETNLTNLERYLAFQPDGAPHEKMVQDHIATTELQGRPNASIHAAMIVTEVQEKSLLDDCKAIVAPWLATGPNALIKTKNLTGWGSNLVAAQSSAGDTGNLSAGACNLTPGAGNGETVRFDAKFRNGAWSVVTSMTLNAGEVVGWPIDGDNVNRRNLRVVLTKNPTKTMQGVTLAQTERYQGD